MTDINYISLSLIICQTLTALDKFAPSVTTMNWITFQKTFQVTAITSNFKLREHSETSDLCD